MIRSLIFCFFFTITLAYSQIPLRSGETRPNVLFLLTDDMGYGDLSINGSPVNHTPNIDKLAGWGVRMNHCYAGSAVDFKLTDFTATAFTDQVIKERGYETQYEAKRWLDLKRLGIPDLKRRIKEATGKDMADKHLFWPIPIGELNFNTALDASKDQNQGY